MVREERDSLEYLMTRSHSVVLYETAGKIQLPILDTADVPEQIFYLHNLWPLISYKAGPSLQMASFLLAWRQV